MASAWMNYLVKRPNLFMQLGLIVFIFISLTPGFGIQYLAWLVPWVVGLGFVATLSYYIAGGVFQFLVYTFWAHGFPWFLANSDRIGPWGGFIIYYEIICWVVIVAISLMYLSPGGIKTHNRQDQ
jgi:hypothetical protein